MSNNRTLVPDLFFPHNKYEHTYKLQCKHNIYRKKSLKKYH